MPIGADKLYYFKVNGYCKFITLYLSYEQSRQHKAISGGPSYSAEVWF